MSQVTSIEIAEMCASDTAEVAAIEQENFSVPWTEKGFLDSLKLSDTLYLVVKKKDKIVGYCGFFQSFDEADITNVAVAQEVRNQGIGKKMLERLMQLGKERGVKRFTLEVRTSNKAAIHLYESLGFVSVGIRKNFYEKPKEDANIMWTGEE